MCRTIESTIFIISVKNNVSVSDHLNYFYSLFIKIEVKT